MNLILSKFLNSTQHSEMIWLIWMKCHGEEHFKVTNWCWGFCARRSFWSNKFENNSQVAYTPLFAFHVPTLLAPDNLSLLLQFPPLHQVLEQLPQIISLRLNITEKRGKRINRVSVFVTASGISHISHSAWNASWARR